MSEWDKGYWLGGIVAGTVAIVSMIAHYPKNIVPEVDKVQSGYAIPRDLGIETSDLDGNGELETIIKYKVRPFLLRIDDIERPVVQSYEIRPVEYSEPILEKR